MIRLQRLSLALLYLFHSKKLLALRIICICPAGDVHVAKRATAQHMSTSTVLLIQSLGGIRHTLPSNKLLLSLS